MSDVVVAYVPVLHEGYWRFLDAHGRSKPVWVVGRELHADYRPLAKDVRALDPALVAKAIAAWGIASEVAVLDEAGARRLGESGASVTLPAEDVSYQLVERWLPRNPVAYDTAFLRWDKSKSVQLLRPRPAREVAVDEAIAELVGAAEEAAGQSLDWWRQVGAAMRLRDGTLLAAANEHLPHPQSPYAAGDPRGNFFQGVHLELSTAAHAEARLIAQAAREGRVTEGALLYVTDFPCPPCAKLVAGAGVARLYYGTGYAVLDGQDVLDAAGVEVVRVG